ncbi:unnamed protein product [Dibothriocephalus latus]|uniref:ubiquitinyl hydrolase 1 n=1 Tax=Dibothriocephalus latus TaxID=60516 RepID=A0A3P7LP24_DIBLA|nr:unnamed protein product [Dibothriocephalus latus]
MNNLLQGPYFEVTDLAAIAHELDAWEHAALGQTSSEPSCLNNDETGFFSIQIIVFCPQVGFVCHYMQHWFAIRKLGNQWFDLNSMFSRPKLISKTYLSLYLAQLRQEGNSIYFVAGRLPECEADLYLQVRPHRPQLQALLMDHLGAPQTLRQELVSVSLP